MVYHVANKGRYGASEEYSYEVLQRRLAAELEGAEGLRILVQRHGGDIEEVEVTSGTGPLLTLHEKTQAEETKISERIVVFARAVGADVLVMGSTGTKEESSVTFQKVTLGSSAHVAAARAPCTVVLIRPGYKVDLRLAAVYMVAVDGSSHSMHALGLCSDWARRDKDEVVCHVLGPPEFTEPLEELCTTRLQESMRAKRVEYAVIPTELEDSAEDEAEELASAAEQCRFRQQAFLVFGARGRGVENESASPKLGRSGSRHAEATLGHVAEWCIKRAQCSLIIARPKGSKAPLAEMLIRSSSV